MTRNWRHHRLIIWSVLAIAVLSVGIGFAMVVSGEARGPVEVPVAEMLGRPLPTNHGVWVGCGDLRQVDAVEIDYEGSLNSKPDPPLTDDNPSMAQSLYADACREVAVDEKPWGSTVCPEDSGLRIDGRFLSGSRSVATFVDHATGCAELSLTVGDGPSVSSVALGRGFADFAQFTAELQGAAGKAFLLPGSPGYQPS